MAKKKAVKEEIKDDDILAPEPKEEKPKTFVGFHPITGEEVFE